MLFPKSTFYVSKCKIIFLLTIYLNLLSYRALPENKIYEIKVFLVIDDVFKPFEIVVLANFHDKYSQKTKKEVVIFLSFFVFEEKDHGMMFVRTPCIIYFNIMGFMSNKLKELQLLFFLESSLC